MAKIFPGRYSARIDGPFVVFLIGLRVNQVWNFRKWGPTAGAMRPMLDELHRHPEMGFLGSHSSLYWRGVMVTQYWRSFDHLVKYAQARDAQHLPAWSRFNRMVGGDGSVGIWHETYQVAAGQYETVYANMPRFGMAACGDHIPATGRMHDARGRMRAEEENDSSAAE